MKPWLSILALLCLVGLAVLGYGLLTDNEAPLAIAGPAGVAVLPTPPPVDEEGPAFPGLSGPAAATTLPLANVPATAPATYTHASTTGIAVLLQTPDSSWLGIAHGLKSMGIPFRVVTAAEQALEHEVILVYPTLTGANTAPETLRAFAEHVRNGNTLIAFAVIGGGMPDLFGFESTTERNDLLAMHFDSVTMANFATLPVLLGADSVDLEIPLAAQADPQPMPGVSYHGLKHPPLALFDDGSAAIAFNFYSTGNKTGYAYAIGIDFGHFILRSHNGRYGNLASSYVNEYQPKLDTLLRFLASVYWQASTDAVQLMPTPYNKEFTALLTHDIDYVQSLDNASEYASYERSQNIDATYFLQTKYISDYYDLLYFTSSRRPQVAALAGLNMEIASHSVAHSNAFASMPVGTGQERYPEYRPFVRDFDTVIGASIAGELRISKFLLETLVSQEVISFRPGHLSLPAVLPEMLVATGYQFSSSISANHALTHLPYRMNYGREYSTEVDIFEFPVTIEDESGRLGDRLDAAIEVANRIAQYRGLVNILIHPDVLDHKLEFEKGFVSAFRDRAWFGSLGAYGKWWATRDSLALEVTTLPDGNKVLHLQAPASIAGLTIKVAPQWTLASGPPDSVQAGQYVIVGEFSGATELHFIAE